MFRIIGQFISKIISLWSSLPPETKNHLRNALASLFTVSVAEVQKRDTSEEDDSLDEEDDDG
jgi:hypothetical protein